MADIDGTPEELKRDNERLYSTIEKMLYTHMEEIEKVQAVNRKLRRDIEQLRKELSSPWVCLWHKQKM